ncbi:MAG: RusA family crossover junction endodeoxyribonuclease [Steroidobacteraceae bacterium]|nr:RusA family crossover junction endodeoxyribonuclease [Steroidobacteraceae bacterium]
MIEFFVPTEPQGKKSPVAARFGNHTRILKSAKTRRYEEMVTLFASQAMAGAAPIDEAVTIAVTAVLSVPASWSQRKRQQALSGLIIPTRKPDGSNIVKSIEDGCKGVVFRDDALVSDGSWSKRYGATPGVQVRIWPTVPACQAVDGVAPQLDLEAA